MANKPMYALINGQWVLVSSQAEHTHTTADITGLGSYPDSTGKPVDKIPTTDGAGGWTYEDPIAAAGVPTGGSTGQVVMKASNTDYDLSWGAIAMNTVYSVDLGAVTNGVPYTVTHNLNTRDIVVSAVSKTVATGGEGDGDIVDVDVAITSADTVDLTFASDGVANKYRVTIAANGSSAVEAQDLRVQVSEPSNPQIGTIWVQP